MKTTTEMRAALKRQLTGGVTAHDILCEKEKLDLIDDVNDATALLERAGEALEYGGACTCIEADIDEPIPPCPRCELQPLVAAFLKEPKS
ncbi:hypothetical protein LCGC14_2037640 [marine sediment metagenome]|uniref:Uncharacterized protein n=1 Tax=marine sediment metagenome TaxID=412755 RepID=A0A0F9FFG1_9ZZZZ